MVLIDADLDLNIYFIPIQILIWSRIWILPQVYPDPVLTPGPDRQALDVDPDPAKLCQSDRIRDRIRIRSSKHLHSDPM
jgi:hypothetical protein